MGFPKTGNCSQSEIHQIRLVTALSDSYIAHKRCDQCEVALDSVYFNDCIVYPHYYLCPSCSVSKKISYYFK